MAQAEKMKLTSLDIAEQKREQLKQALTELLPEAAGENGIDFDQLKRALGAWVEPGKERFGLQWPGKADCMKIIQQPSVATLKPAREESVNFDETENLFIEGDNLEVLKLLQKSYFGKVKMIYIDPPYNTGKEFIYPDKYSETLDTYLTYTGQIDDEGKKFSTNADTDGRYHSRWLNMMYPRLYLARNLLREDGVVFISIDDNEVSHLRELCNLIFGEENFVAQFVVQTNPRGRSLDKFVAKTFEYVICYARSTDSTCIYPIAKSDKALEDYSQEDDSGKYRLLELRNRNPVFNRSNRPNLYFPIYINPEKGGVSLQKTSEYCEEALPLNSQNEEGCWTWSKNKVESEKDLLVGKKVSTGSWRVYRKDYIPQDGATTKEKSLWIEKNLNHENGKEELASLFNVSGNKAPFDFPKSVELVKKCIRIASKKDDIILDFFAGSATTAQACLEMNVEDSGARKFILVQLPEPLDNQSENFKSGYKTIADVSKERIRLALKKTKHDLSSQLDFTGNLDLGFKVFKLDRSNFKVWEGSVEQIQNLEQQLSLHVEHIAKAATSDDILYELLLKSGFPLATKVEKLNIAGKEVYSIEEGAMLICLEKELTQALIDALAETNPLQVICLDEGFKGNDQLKANAVQTFKARAQAEESEIVFKTV